MKLKDLKRGSRSAWPPSSDGPYNPSAAGPHWHQEPVGILTDAQPSAPGRGIRFMTEFEGRPYTYHLWWDAVPGPDELAAALRRLAGTDAASLGDVEIDLAARFPGSN